MDEKMDTALANGIKDTMWAMFWKGKQEANLPELEESCKRLIRMTTQKDAGQRGNSTCIDWKSLDMEFLRIAIEATAFVLDERFDYIKDLMEGTAWHSGIPETDKTKEYLTKDASGVIETRLYHPSRGWGHSGRTQRQEITQWAELPR